jgi:hypothetical protein
LWEVERYEFDVLEAMMDRTEEWLANGGKWGGDGR